MTKRDHALREVKKLGIEPGDKRYPDAVSALTRGWPVWKVAQAYKLDPHLIHRLGGPKPPGAAA